MALLGFPIGQQETVNQPQQAFVWGSGGRRLTPEDIALQRQIGEQQRMSGADFSPVGSVWEGLGRVVQGYSGGLAERRANRAADANAAESQSIAELLMGQGEGAPDNNAVLQALANPYITDEVRQLAGMLHQQMNQQVEPVIQRANNGDIIGLNPMTGEVMFRQADPNPKPVVNWQMVTDPVSGAVSYIPFGPDGPMGVSGGNQPPATLPPDFDFGEGGADSNVSSNFP